MIYRLLTSKLTDRLAYITAGITALWDFIVRMHPAQLPQFMQGVSPLWGVSVSVFFGALLICKYIFIEGNALTIKQLKSEKAHLEGTIAKRDATVASLTETVNTLRTTEKDLNGRLEALREKESSSQLSELRKKIRELEIDNKTSLSVVSRNLKERLNDIKSDDQQIVFAVNVLRQELELVENEIKRGEISSYELSLKISGINENLFDLQAIMLSSLKEADGQNNDNASLNFLRMGEHTDPSCLDMTYKFFKVAFHPDRFSSEALKNEAHRYFQQTVQAYNSFKRKTRASA
jgi:hypothetical protein